MKNDLNLVHNYSRAKDNPSMLKTLARKLYAYAATAETTQHSKIVKTLLKFADSLNIHSEVCGKKADVYPCIIQISSDLHNLHEVLSGGGAGFDLDKIIDNLDNHIRGMYLFFEHQVSSPTDGCDNASIRKFLYQKACVESIVGVAENQLALAKKTLYTLQSTEPSNIFERRSLERQIKSAHNTVLLRQAIVESMTAILIQLNALADTAVLSPKLSRRVSRLIKPSVIGDFFDSPQKAQTEREKLFAQLYQINKNIKKTSDSVIKSDAVLDAQIARDFGDEIENDEIDEANNVIQSVWTGETVSDKIKHLLKEDN